MGSRVAAEKVIIDYIDMILPGSKNTEEYRKKFKKMSNADFKRYIDDLKTGKVKLTIQVPPFQKSKLKMRRNIAVAKKLGFSFHRKLKYPAMGDEPAHTTPHEFMVLELPVRRTAQTVVKNVSTPTDTSVVDVLTGQPTGSSKGAAITYPEVQLLPLEDTLNELMKYRGGDSGSYQALMRSLTNTGTATADDVELYSTGVTSKKTLKTYLTACHIKNNL